MTIALDLHGDIFNSGCEALVNPTNQIGPMGKGLALEFSKKFPGLEDDYRDACKGIDPPTPSNPYVWKAKSGTYIICLPTKNHWRDKSKLSDIIYGIDALAGVIENLDIKSVAIPALGCGLGGLKWNQIHPIISYMLDHLQDRLIVLYPPQERKR